VYAVTWLPCPALSLATRQAARLPSSGPRQSALGASARQNIPQPNPANRSFLWPPKINWLPSWRCCCCCSAACGAGAGAERHIHNKNTQPAGDSDGLMGHRRRIDWLPIQPSGAPEPAINRCCTSRSLHVRCLSGEMASSKIASGDVMQARLSKTACRDRPGSSYPRAQRLLNDVPAGCLLSGRVGAQSARALKQLLVARCKQAAAPANWGAVFRRSAACDAPVHHAILPCPGDPSNVIFFHALPRRPPSPITPRRHVCPCRTTGRAHELVSLLTARTRTFVVGARLRTVRRTAHRERLSAICESDPRHFPDAGLPVRLSVCLDALRSATSVLTACVALS